MRDSLISRVNEEIDAFCQKVDVKVEKEQQQLKACKKKSELESKLAHEMKINSELKHQLAELNTRSCELERVCASFESLTIAESDKNRLENAKDLYQLAKELTGVRFDFSAPPTVAKGYVTNEARRLLQHFEIEAGDSEALWSLIKSTSSLDWPTPQDKENVAHN